jgi:hypothetical protein
VAIHWASRNPSRSITWAIGLLFAIGSTCFMIGPFPGFVQLVGSAADGTVFFVGSLFFTAAALLQFRESKGRDRIPTLIQLAGTLFFNVDTYRAMQASYDTHDVNRVVWAPEAAGSICFLISGLLAYLAVRGVRSRDRRVAAINFAGCVLFGISTIASYVVPATGDILDLAAANWTTALGALCFLIGSLMLLPLRSSERAPQ